MIKVGTTGLAEGIELSVVEDFVEPLVRVPIAIA